MWRSRETELPFPHLSEVFLGAGNGSGPMTDLRQFGILWVASPHKCSGLAVVCLSPRFYPH